MITSTEVLLILGMFAVTFGVRYVPLVLSGRITFSKKLERALRFVPVAVLTAITVPMVITPGGEWQLSVSNPYLIASIVSIAVAAWRRSVLLTIVVGLVVFFLWRYWMQ
jgi:branched-subunit amino acid transport protein